MINMKKLIGHEAPLFKPSHPATLPNKLSRDENGLDMGGYLDFFSRVRIQV